MTSVESEISSKELMEEICARAALEFVEQLRKSNASSDNQLLRQLKGLHSNTSLADLSEEQKKLVKELSQRMFGYINRHGYVLVPRDKNTRR